MHEKRLSGEGKESREGEEQEMGNECEYVKIGDKLEWKHLHEIDCEKWIYPNSKLAVGLNCHEWESSSTYFVNFDGIKF